MNIPMERESIATDELVKRCQQGDREAVRRLYDQYSRAMYHICLRMMNDVHDAEDMLQESFFQVFKSIGAFRGESTIGAWIKRIVINKCLNQLKKKSPVFVSAEDQEFEQSAPVDEQKFAFTVERVKKAIAKLPDGYRVILSLYLFEEYSHKQIAEKLGISESTAKTQYMRAKQRVRDWVKAELSEI